MKVVINPLKPFCCSILTILAIVRRDRFEVRDLLIWLKCFRKNRREKIRVRSSSYGSLSPL
jgi:hypothetical protein